MGTWTRNWGRVVGNPCTWVKAKCGEEEGDGEIGLGCDRGVKRFWVSYRQRLCYILIGNAREFEYGDVAKTKLVASVSISVYVGLASYTVLFVVGACQ